MDKIFHNGNRYSADEMKQIVLEYYKSVFSNKNDRHFQMQKLFPDTLDSEARVLDYGCGMGGISQLLYEKYRCTVDGVDISENELIKAKITYGDNPHINFILLDEFEFPKEKYDLVFSSQVIEHVHNPGNYLSKINYMLKDNGYLLIGLPNIVNLHYITSLMFFSEAKARKHSYKIFENYNKASDHIQGWDPLHFITLLASCGFKLERYLPTEGTPLSMALKRIPLIGKYIYILPFTSRLSYTMFFLAKKISYVNIGTND